MNKRAELCCVSWSKYVERWGDLLFLDLMYLYSGVICCRRCSFLDRCICNLLFFELADAFQPACHVQLHLHLSFSRLWGYFLLKFYICIPRFLWSADASHQNFASSTCSFYDLQILPIKIMHLQSSKISYRRYLSQIPFAFFLLHVLSHTWLTKKLI